jgi:adenine-specific DNA-methyltransferase
MASLFAPFAGAVRLLDAGAGAGALTEAFVSRLCKNPEAIRTVEVALYELDPRIQDSLLETMQACQSACARAGVQFRFSVHQSDFIQEVSAQLEVGLFAGKAPAFDAAIVNPPYRKISTDSTERLNLRSAGIETVNLYAGFIALIQRLLIPGRAACRNHSSKLLQRPVFPFISHRFFGKHGATQTPRF